MSVVMKQTDKWYHFRALYLLLHLFSLHYILFFVVVSYLNFSVKIDKRITKLGYGRELFIMSYMASMLTINEG